MVASQCCCLVLWGEQCDEAAAALFVTNLRAAGLRVWVVGVSGKRLTGAHGLGLLTDLALDQALALAPTVICLILPCDGERLARLLNDPRLVTLLQVGAAQQAHFLLAGNEGSTAPARHLADLFAGLQVGFYPAAETLLPFIQRLIDTLKACHR